MKRIILDLLTDVTRYAKEKGDDILLPTAEEYAKDLDETKFKKDVRDTLRFVYERSHSFHGYFADVVAHMCVTQFSKAFDLGDVKGIFPKKAEVTHAITDFLNTHTEQEVATHVHNLLHRIDATIPYIVVQTPLPLGGEQKQALRTELMDRYGRCFPKFSVNKSLLGGLRIFINGETIEHTWQSRLQEILSTLYSHV